MIFREGRRGELQQLKTKEVVLRIQSLVENGLRQGLSIDSLQFSFMHNYPLMLTDGEPLNPKNAGKATYPLSRLFEDIFSTQRNIDIVLTNDHRLFLNNRDRIKTSKDRRRWGIIEDDNTETTKIFIHIRDKNISDSTDLKEIMSFFGIISILRKSKWMQLKKLRRDVKNDSYLQKFSALRSEEEFEKWKKKHLTVKLDFEDSRGGATTVLVDQIKTELKNKKIEITKNNEPYLFIGNDFSFRLMMFTLLLNSDQIRNLEEIYQNNLSDIEKQINEKKAGPLFHDFIKKYSLLTMLNKDYSSIKPDDSEYHRKISLYESIFNEENYQALGFTRLLYGVRPPLNNSSDYQRSILAEPVDLWLPENFKLNLLNDESGFVKKIFERLIRSNKKIMSIPYVTGNLCVELVDDLIRNGLVNRDSMAFSGKVGSFFEDGESHLNRGDTVLLTSVSDIEGESIEVRNKLEFGDELFGIINTIQSAHNITVPAVSLEAYNDFTNAKKKFSHLTTEMELFPLTKYLNENNIGLYAVYYVSDVMRRAKKSLLPDWFGRADAENINQKMTTAQAALSVGIATLLTLYGLSRD